MLAGRKIFLLVKRIFQFLGTVIMLCLFFIYLFVIVTEVFYASGEIYYYYYIAVDYIRKKHFFEARGRKSLSVNRA